MRLITDAARCIGSATCVLTDPDVFGQNEENGTVVVYAERLDHAHAERIRQAVRLCPSRALAIVDEDNAN